MRYLKIASVLLLIAGLFACNNTPADQAKAANEQKYFDDYRLGKDAEFLVEYAAFLNLSTEMSKVAADKAQTGEVQTLASDLQDDHRAMKAELGRLADQYRIELPEKLSEQQQRQLDLLASDGIDQIDALYLTQVIRKHEAWEPKLKDVIAHTQVDTILDFARKISAHQFRHLEQARRLAETAPAS